MKVYLAGPWTRKDDAAQIAQRLEAAGHTITRAWWNFEAGDEEHEKLGILAQEDLEAVFAADEVVVLNLEKSEGKAVETGFAIAMSIPVSLIGLPTNIFHHLPDVVQYSSIDTWLTLNRNKVA